MHDFIINEAFKIEVDNTIQIIKTVL